MLKWLIDKLVPPLEPRPAEPPPSRCPLNADGSWYTTGICMACGLPEGEVPELLAPFGAGHHTTYFVRQPETAEEVAHACEATKVCCVDDIRYGGTDPDILRRLHPGVCDHALVDGRVVSKGAE